MRPLGANEVGSVGNLRPRRKSERVRETLGSGWKLFSLGFRV